MAISSSKSKIQYQYKADNLNLSEPNKINVDGLRNEEMIINLGPPSPKDEWHFGSYGPQDCWLGRQIAACDHQKGES